jgi:hypothetical protein
LYSARSNRTLMYRCLRFRCGNAFDHADVRHQFRGVFFGACFSCLAS